MSALAKKCWKSAPMQRPSFTDVRRTLANIYNTSTFTLDKIKQSGGISQYLKNSIEDCSVDLPFDIDHYNTLVSNKVSTRYYYNTIL